jgi:hypothetical protein
MAGASNSGLSLNSLIRGAKVECQQDENRLFIPCGFFNDENFTQERIYDLLGLKCSRADDTIRNYLIAIQKHRKRLLAIFVLCRFTSTMLQNAMAEFVKLGITDDDLPFHRFDQTETDFKLCSRHHQDDEQQRSIVMSALYEFEDLDIRDFCRNQWSVLAAVFERSSDTFETVPHYEWRENVLLPFVRRPRHNRPGPRAGGYGRVWSGWIAAGHQHLIGSERVSKVIIQPHSAHVILSRA